MFGQLLGVQLGAAPTFARGLKADIGPERRATSERRGRASTGPGVHSSSLLLASEEAFFPSFAAHALHGAPATISVGARRVHLSLATSMALTFAARAARPSDPSPATSRTFSTISSGTIRLASLSEMSGSGASTKDEPPGERWEELVGQLGWAEALGQEPEWPGPQRRQKFVPTACLACTYKRR